MNSELENRFSHLDAGVEDLISMEIIREKFIELAQMIDERCPVSREKSLALTNLEISSFYVNASIVRY